MCSAVECSVAVYGTYGNRGEGEERVYGLRRIFVFFFFFQAEDGIRDLTVTGVQTCALPISGPMSTAAAKTTAITAQRAKSLSNQGESHGKHRTKNQWSAKPARTCTCAAPDRKSVV